MCLKKLKEKIKKKKQIVKILSLALAVAMMLCTLIVSVSAETIYPTYFKSPNVLTGVWKDGMENGAQRVNTALSPVYAGDVGMYFYSSKSFTMPSSIARDSGRRMKVIFYENDPESRMEICEYTGYFGIDSQGKYHVLSYGRKDVYDVPTVIEASTNVEFLYTFRIDTLASDSSRNIPEELFYVRYWVLR